MQRSRPTTYNDINWAALRSEAFAQKGWSEKGPADWDKKAPSFASRNKDSGYVELFLLHLPLSKTATVLDIGCGPGTLALPIARQVARVTALDFSSKMLEVLDQQAGEEGLQNITTVQAAWEDDWRELGIEQHDIVIASRSMGVKDLEGSLAKLNAFASQFVFISDRIGASPFEPEAFAAVGRPFQAGPDYIFTVNTLYTMNIHPHIRILELEAEASYPDMEAAVQGLSWMFSDLTADERSRLHQYVADHVVRRCKTGITVRRSSPPRWALMWWTASSSPFSSASKAVRT